MSSSLFSVFPPSSGNWESLVESELKKPGAAQTLIWHTDENFEVKPYHTSYLNPDVETLAAAVAKLATRPAGQEFFSYQVFEGKDPIQLKTRIADALNGGVNGFTLVGDFDSSAVTTILEGVLTEYLWVEFVSSSPSNAAKVLADRLKYSGVSADKQLGSVPFSPLQNLAEKGNWEKSQQLNQLKDHLAFMARELPSMQAMCVNAGLVANAGGNITQQLAFALSQGNEYLNWAQENNLDLKTTASQINFHFSIGTNFLLECVKIRSFKWLWQQVLKEYGVLGVPCFVSSCTSTIGSGIYDSHNNLLRYTTASMSAIISGSDAHTALAFDSIYKESSGFSDRISRNITNLLLEEAFLGKVENVSNGSFAFDNLQYQLTTHAWELFRSWENRGGFEACIINGTLAKEIAESATKLQAKFDANQLVVLGVNKYPNKNEKKANDWNGNSPEVGSSPLAIKPFRLADKSELERLKQEL